MKTFICKILYLKLSLKSENQRRRNRMKQKNRPIHCLTSKEERRATNALSLFTLIRQKIWILLRALYRRLLLWIEWKPLKESLQS